jgi:hypothetical protein
VPRPQSLAARKLSYDTRAMERAKGEYVAELAGGEEQARKHLSLCEDPQVQKFLRALTKREKRGQSVYAVASRFGITVSQMVDIMREGFYSGTLNEMFKAAALTAQATIQDAQPRFAVCPQCDGRRTVVFSARYSQPDPSGNRTLLDDERVDICPNCQGEGRIRQAGSSKAQEMIFRATKVLEEKQLVINNNLNNFSGVDSVIDELDSRRLPRRRAPVIEVSPEPE